MEIKVNIPQNDYARPTEVRQEVVQDICDAFLGENYCSTYHPHSNGMCRNAHCYVVKKQGVKAFGFRDKPFYGEQGAEFNGEEMKTAFKLLREAGYHIFRVYSYGTWLGYVVRKQDFMNGGTEVYSFEDRID